jgi:hypothetical protein
MAALERNGGGNPPDAFQNIMKAAALPRMELSGFRGHLSRQINKWHEHGLGKAIGFPLFDKEGKTKVGDFQGILFALPLTDSDTRGLDQRVLLLSPTDNECRFVVVAPRQSAKDEENIVIARKFHDIFTPSLEPFYPFNWNHEPKIDPFSEFLIRPTRLDNSVIIAEEPSQHEAKELLKQGLEIAKREALKREMAAEIEAERVRVKSIQVDDSSLRMEVPDIVDDLALLNEFLDRTSKVRKAQASEGEKILAQFDDELAGEGASMLAMLEADMDLRGIED